MLFLHYIWHVKFGLCAVIIAQTLTKYAKLKTECNFDYSLIPTPEPQGRNHLWTGY